MVYNLTYQQKTGKKFLRRHHNEKVKLAILYIDIHNSTKMSLLLSATNCLDGYLRLWRIYPKICRRRNIAIFLQDLMLIRPARVP
jgi:hypothetical protein